MTPEIRRRVSLLNPIHLLALGFGSGLAPKMPGTFGSLVAIPLVILFATYLSTPYFIFVAVFASIVGIWICGKTAEDMQVHDHSSIVWDEIAGMLVAFIAVPLSWQSILVGFCLFRFFDIVKPWPISYLDKNLHHGLGIMLDDIAAGLCALAGLHCLIYWGWL